jgi:transketolase
MRNQIIDAIFDKMNTDPSIFFLTGDMGINLVEKIGKKFPDRFLNVGIAEQNLIGVAGGLANIGFRPFAYTISNFLIHRCFEQIRNDIVLHEYPVTLLGTSAGFDNSPLGPTHHIIDDWGALRSFPGIDIYSPNSVAYAEGLVDKILDRKRPAYVRISKGEFAEPSSTDDVVHLRGSLEGTLLVSYGAPAQDCLSVHKDYPKIGCLVLNRLVPLAGPTILNIMSQYSKIVVVEDHFGATGLYSMLCELSIANGLSKQILSRAPLTYSKRVGKSNRYFHRENKFDPQSLIQDFAI